MHEYERAATLKSLQRTVLIMSCDMQPWSRTPIKLIWSLLASAMLRDDGYRSRAGLLAVGYRGAKRQA